MLITGFYDLSRLEAGGYTFVMEPVRLDQVLTELAAAFYSDFLTAGMEPSLELEEKLPLLKLGYGYVMHSDHSVSNLVEYETYAYFVEKGMSLGNYT